MKYLWQLLPSKNAVVGKGGPAGPAGADIVVESAVKVVSFNGWAGVEQKEERSGDFGA